MYSASFSAALSVICFWIRGCDGNAWLWLWFVARCPEVHGEAQELLRLIMFIAGKPVVASTIVIIRMFRKTACAVDCVSMEAFAFVRKDANLITQPPRPATADAGELEPPWPRQVSFVQRPPLATSLPACICILRRHRRRNQHRCSSSRATSLPACTCILRCHLKRHQHKQPDLGGAR